MLGEYIGPLVPPLAGHEVLTASSILVMFRLLQWRGVRVGDAAQQITSLLKTVALLGLVAAILLLPGVEPAAVTGGAAVLLQDSRCPARP